MLARVQGVEVGDPVDSEHDGFAVRQLRKQFYASSAQASFHTACLSGHST
jgi:hypothetical protein